MLISLLLTSLSFADNWAVLVAGSNGFSNYRHQSDMYRTYQILTKNGFDPAKIIVMCYDDIASSPSNPFPGKIYNVPDGPDVYIGTAKHDYVKGNVTAANFYKVLLGDASAGGKVLKSTKEDNVFVYYDDHGNTGLLAMPSGGYIYANDLNKTLTQMQQKGMFKKLLFYVEACYAGSMFLNILNPALGIYVTTAANEKESSWAEYCGIAKYKTCLSNEYSQRWMEHSDAIDLTTVTVGQQFELVRTNTKRSHVMDYGDMTVKPEKLSAFQAGNKATEKTPAVPAPAKRNWKTIAQPEAHLTYLRTVAEQDMFGDAAVEYHDALSQKRLEDQRFDRLTAFFGLSDADFDEKVAQDTELFKESVETFELIKGRLNEFNFWTITTLLTRAVNENKLTRANVNAYAQFLRTIA